MRILVATVDYPPIEGGIASVALYTARELAAMGHDVTVLAPWFAGMEAFDAAEPVRVVRFRGYGLGPMRLLPFLWAAWPLARETDLLLAINPAYGGVLGLLARRVGTPYVAFAYAYEFLKFARTPLAGRLLRRVYANARRVVAISRFTRDELVRFGVDEAHIAIVLPGAVPAEPVSPAEAERVARRYTLDTPRVILAVGRLVPRKGFRTLARAMPAVLARYPDALLVIAGRGPDMSPLAKLCNELGVRGQVLLPGKVPSDDLAALYDRCAVFALPTESGAGGQVEGFGLVFAEAAARGKPVVAGRAGGVVDAVLDGETGLLVPPGDAGATADALLRLFDDPALAERLGQAGLDRVAHELNWRRFAEGVLAAADEHC